MASVGAVASSVDGGENTRLAFFTAEPHVERMCVDRYGNVGIGVTDPVSKLELGAAFNSDGNTTNMISFRNSQTGYYEWQIGPTLYSGSAAFSIRGGDDGYGNLSNIFNIVNQNVGIGTTSPDDVFETYDSVGRIKITRSANNNNYGCSLDFALLNSANAKKTYARIGGSIADNTSGSEDGFLSFQVMTNGVMGDAYQQDKMRITSGGNVGIGTVSPGAKLDVNGGIRTRLPHLWARQTTQPSGTTSLLLTWNSTVYNDTTVGNMYSTTRTCNFPIKGVYVVTVQAHSYIGGGGSYYTDFKWVQKQSNGSTRWTTYNNPSNLSQNSGNSDMHITGTMTIVANAGDYLEVTHSTSVTTERNYNGGWNNIRAACIYAIN